LVFRHSPYESPRAEQRQKPLNDGKSIAKNTGTAAALGCLMIPACFVAFYVVCNATGQGQIGVQPKWDVGLAPSFSAAALVAAAFIYAIKMTLKRSRRG
jgi:hypothetical protein